MIEIYELQVFLAAAETENFSTAARRLHLTQPAVSQHIQALEHRLGTPLFHRLGRSIRLTEAGHVLTPLARDLLTLSTQIEETVQSLGGQVVGDLRIACSTTSGKYILPHLAARFRALHPRVRITVEVTGQRSALEKVSEGRVQLAVSSSQLPHRDLIYQDFFIDRVVLIVRADHPWTERDAIHAEELLSVPHIVREPTSGTRQVVQAGLARHGISLEQLDTALELGNAEAIEMAVEEGIGVAFVSRLAARRGVELGRIREVAVDGLDLRRPIYIAYHAGQPASLARQRFWDFVHEPGNETLLRLAV